MLNWLNKEDFSNELYDMSSAKVSAFLQNSQDNGNKNFHRIFISNEDEGYHLLEIQDVLSNYMRAINLRRKYALTIVENNKEFISFDNLNLHLSYVVKNYSSNLSNNPKNLNYTWEWKEGIVYVYLNSENPCEKKPLFYPSVTDLREYYRDMNTIVEMCHNGPCKSHSYVRLRILEAKFNMHRILNQDKEKFQQMQVSGRDFYNVYKVDTHVHLASSMNQKHLLKFIKRKLIDESNIIVLNRDKKLFTLSEVFQSLNINVNDLSVDRLDVHSDNKTFNRFDRFNLKYNPVGESCLREIFMKTENYISGRYLAEITRELILNLQKSKYQCAEWRVSIYGRSMREWSNLASWIVDNELISNQVRYLVQIPRLYDVYYTVNSVSCFQDILECIFNPLFESTLHPEKDPVLSFFLEYCTGFDCVDDESKSEIRFSSKFPSPKEWNTSKNPTYSYYLFYLWSNIYTLNNLRASMNMSTFTFRPHSGEAGDLDHLVSSFLLATGIAHGINLRLSPVLQYLYYLTQIPMAMSPLSNNSLFLKYKKNPFPILFARGLNVSLSTDDPLQFHYTKEPLIEEYSVAAQMWKFTACDICEIARISVLQSGFPDFLKSKWIGENYKKPGIQGNDMSRTNVPNIRIAFRHETLMNEYQIIYNSLKGKELDLDLSFMTSAIFEGQSSISQSHAAMQGLANSKAIF